MFTITNHRLDQAEFIESPNFSERPEGVDPSLIVVHNISLPPGRFGGDFIKQFFVNSLNSELHPYFKEISDLRVSSHLLIERDGNIIQFVEFNKSAWHAGVSEYEGQKDCNDFSIGIELEGTDSDPYQDIQYSILSGISECLMGSYLEINKERIIGHADIAPDRKTDPGDSFDWLRFRDSLN
ncbi:uncharacterized protein METZ01_LOCUS129870 [marine metagenome]|uniref:1,6-anhydro-N-acetylmuramyl-L-alanine amidase AmpD n=1 Tax=marine metagenome TaxID=408172 RepID=A0A381YIV1_9ZZZZ